MPPSAFLLELFASPCPPQANCAPETVGHPACVINVCKRCRCVRSRSPGEGSYTARVGREWRGGGPSAQRWAPGVSGEQALECHPPVACTRVQAHYPRAAHALAKADERGEKAAVVSGAREQLAV